MLSIEKGAQKCMKNEFSKTGGYKINIQKSTISTY